MMRILQINVGIGRDSQGLMKQVVEEIKADVMVVSEQNRNEGEENARVSDLTSRAAVVVTDRMTVETPGQPKRGFRWVELSGIHHYSVYWPPQSSSSIAEFTNFLDRLETSIKESAIPVIAAGDFNSKSSFWGSSKEDARGALLINLMSALNMAVCNQEKNLTFVRGNSESHIDITFTSISIVNKIINWRILKDESLSLHKYILFYVTTSLRRKTYQNIGPRS